MDETSMRHMGKMPMLRKKKQKRMDSRLRGNDKEKKNQSTNQPVN